MRFWTALLLLSFAAAAASGAARMDSATYTLKPSADQNGGGDGSTSASDYNLSGTVGEIGSAMTSGTNYRHSSGSRRILHYPNAVLDLGAVWGISATSVTLQWSSPGQDGALGDLQPGASYFIVVSSNLAPEHFVFSLASALDSSIRVSTRGPANAGVAPGTVDSTSTKALVANTTWYAHLWTVDTDGNISFASPRATFTSLAHFPKLNGRPDLNAYYVGDTSITLQWAGLVPTPVQAASATAQGFVLYASSTNYGALTPGGVVYSSRTNDVRVSTLTVGDDTALDYCTTYYFRLATLNWADATNYIVLHSSPTYDDDAVTMTVHSIDLGDTNMGTVLVVPTGVDVENTGRCPATYQVKAGTVTAGSPWVIAPAAGADQYTLSAGFNAAAPAQGAFGGEDLLTDSAAASSATKFAIGQSGYRVPRGEFRKLWLRLETPSVTSTEATQDVRVTIIAVRDPP